MPVFYMICGIPMSGKSSIAKKISKTENAVIFSFDKIKRELHNGDIYYPNYNKETLLTIQSRVGDALKKRENVVIDAVNKNKFERKRYIKQAKNRGYYTVCVYCKKDYDYAIHENRMRDETKKIPEDILKQACDSFTPPDEKEGWDEIRIIYKNMNPKI